MQRRVAGLLAVVMAGIMSVEQTNFASAQPTCVTFPSPDMCNWGHEFTTARDTLGQEDAWSIEYLDDDYALTNMDTGKVRFSPSIPCQLVGPVARHEYMHQLQGEFYGGDERVDEAYHDEASIEEVADCGARLIDPTNVPYAWGTCDSGSVRDNARMLIDFNGG